MDIKYGDGTSPGGFKYTLLLVDRTTHKTWVYGLRDMTGSTIADAIWSFFSDAGGIPLRIQCDFDPRFLGSKVRRLFTSRGIRVTASPSNRQSQNGLVKSHWKTAKQMARSFLAEAHLPKSFWFWALRESIARMNLIPVRFKDNPSDLTTPATRTVLWYSTRLACPLPIWRPRLLPLSSRRRPQKPDHIRKSGLHRHSPRSIRQCKRTHVLEPYPSALRGLRRLQA